MVLTSTEESVPTQNLNTQPVRDGNNYRDQENSTNSNGNHVSPGTSNQTQQNTTQPQRSRNRNRRKKRYWNSEQTETSRNIALVYDGSQVVFGPKPTRNNSGAHDDPQQVLCSCACTQTRPGTSNQTQQNTTQPQRSRNRNRRKKKYWNCEQTNTSRNIALGHDGSQAVSYPEGSRNNDRAHDNPQLISRSEASSNELAHDDQQPISRSETAKNSDAVGLEMNQKELLVFQLTNESLECSICFEAVLRNDATWSCNNCYHILHMTCATTWALESEDFYWRCPACRHATMIDPNCYYCFCGKTKNPIWNQSYCPHSCDQYCGQVLQPFCGHRCVWPCHPGPCPPCQSFLNKKCDLCGTERVVYCNSTEPVLCEGTCTKVRSCGTHQCLQLCHAGSCPPCEYICNKFRSCEIHRCLQPCHTGACPACKADCLKNLTCGNHRCLYYCHTGRCPPCKNTCDKFSSCGKRHCPLPCHNGSCPPCMDHCNRMLNCQIHFCNYVCHTGRCPPCSQMAMIEACICGDMKRPYQCGIQPSCIINNTCGLFCDGLVFKIGLFLLLGLIIFAMLKKSEQL